MRRKACYHHRIARTWKATPTLYGRCFAGKSQSSPDKKEEGGILLDDRCWLSLASLSWGGYARRGRGRRWQHWMGGHPSSSAEWKWAENCFSFFFSAPGGVLVFTLCVNNHSSLLPRESAAASRASHASSARDRGISISAIYSNITTTKTTTRLLRRLLSKERS